MILTEQIDKLLNLADKLAAQSREDSKTVLEVILILDNDCIEAHRRIAHIYYDSEFFDRAIEHFLVCVQSNSADHIINFYLANAYRNIGDLKSAVVFYKKSLELCEYPEGMVNLASAYSASKDKILELQQLEKLTEKFPGYTLGLYNLGIYHYEQRNLKSSIAAYRRALEIDPNHGQSKVALSLALLMDKQYVEGFVLHDSRWGVSPNCPTRDFGRPFWYGQDINPSSSILITLEQGFGDTLQMLRYVPLLGRQFNSVVIEVQPAMQRLVALAFPGIQVVVHGDKLPNTDYYCPIMSLPRAFETTYDTIPNSIKYLSVSVRDRQFFDSTLANSGRKKIGICWRGGMLNPAMAHRSLTLNDIRPLFDDDTYAWYSLVKDVPIEEYQILTNSPAITDLTEKLTDFLDTYHLIQEFDAVITVDTAVAHLSGAMGKPTIVILNDAYDWRWHVDDDVSVWYPTTRLFRAYKFDKTDGLARHLLQELKNILN